MHPQTVQLPLATSPDDQDCDAAVCDPLSGNTHCDPRKASETSCKGGKMCFFFHFYFFLDYSHCDSV